MFKPMLKPTNDLPTDSPTRSARRTIASKRAGVLLAAAGAVALAIGVGLNQPTADAAAVLADGVVFTTDGRIFEGDVNEAGDTVTVDADGIVTTLQRSEIRTLEYGSIETRLRRRLNEIGTEDLPARLGIGEAALRRALFDLAEEIADDVLAKDPGNTVASQLATRVQRQRRLDQAGGTGQKARNPNEPRVEMAQDADNPTDRRRERRARRGDKSADFASEEQINRIRQIELQPADGQGRRAPRIRFENRALQRYVESKDLQFAQFNRQNDVTKALILIEDAEDEIVEDVLIRTDPQSLLDYKQFVEPAILEGCATSECHGGEDAGNFRLYTKPRGDDVSYTNFYTLVTYSKEVEDASTSAFGGGEKVQRPMIQRLDAMQSLLMNYLLPADQVTYAHPEVEGFKAVFNNNRDPLYNQIGRWMQTTLEDLQGEGYEGLQIGLNTVPQSQPAPDQVGEDGESEN